MGTAQPGSNVYMSDGTGTGATALVALTETTITINGQPVEVTSRDDELWQKLLANAGVKKITIKGKGIVDNGTQAGVLAARALAQSIDQYTANWGSARTIVGGFQLTQFEVSGPFDKEQGYSFQFDSSGSMTLAGTA